MDVRTISSRYGGFWNFDVQDFCYMTNRYFPPEEFLGSLASNLGTLLGSYPSTNSHLSCLVAEAMGSDGDKTVVANGASELISAIASLRMEHLAIPVPTFDEYRNRVLLQGKQVSPYLAEADFTLDVDGFIAHVQRSKADSVVIVRPDNPAGTLVSREDIVRMLQAFGSLGLVLIDESFLYFAGPDYRDLSVAGLIDRFPNLVIVNSMSKAYGVPGLRLGYAMSGDRDFVKDLRAALPIWSINSFAQFFLEHVGDYEAQFERSCEQVRNATDSLFRGLLTVDFVDPYPTRANYVLCRTQDPLTGSGVTERLFQDFGVLVNDCSGKSGLDSRFFRVAARTTEENEGLVRILREMVIGATTLGGMRR